MSDVAFKDAWLTEIRRGKLVFYSTVVAQAQSIDVTGARITFTFADGQRTLRDMFEQNRPWLETLAQTVLGRRVPVTSALGEGVAATAKASDDERKAALKERALADPGVQTLLEVFPVEIRDVEEM